MGIESRRRPGHWGWDLKANVVVIQARPWLTLVPGVAIFLTVLDFNLFGDGLRDALDARPA